VLLWASITFPHQECHNYDPIDDTNKSKLIKILFIKFNYIDEEFEYMGRGEFLEFVKVLWFESGNKGQSQMLSHSIQLQMTIFATWLALCSLW
jgi:hypothetical protein